MSDIACTAQFPTHGQCLSNITLRRREPHELENFLLLPNIGHRERINLLAPFSNFPSLSASPGDHAEAVVRFSCEPAMSLQMAMLAVSEYGRDSTHDSIQRGLPSRSRTIPKSTLLREMVCEAFEFDRALLVRPTFNCMKWLFPSRTPQSDSRIKSLLGNKMVHRRQWIMSYDWSGKVIFGTHRRTREVDHGLPRGSPKEQTQYHICRRPVSYYWAIVGVFGEVARSTDCPKSTRRRRRRVLTPILFERSEVHSNTRKRDGCLAVAY